MLKLFKYEFKNTYKFFTGLVLAIIIANFLLYPISEAMSSSNRIVNENLSFLLIGIFFLVFLGCLITFFFMVVSAYRKDLYQDRSYLTFSLPLSGRQILGAKTLNALFWLLLLGLFLVVINLFGFYVTQGAKELWDTLIDLRRNYFSDNLSIFLGIIIMIIQAIYSILILYFSITLSKVLFKNKKSGYLWFVLFLITSFIISYIAFKLTELLPYFLTYSGDGVINLSQDFQEYGYLWLGTGINGVSIPIVDFILYPILCIMLFFTSSYMLDKKVDF